MTPTPKPTERPLAFPLRRKLGLFAAGLFVLLAMVGSVGVHQFMALRTDGHRLLEESRELALANDLDAHFESIGLLLGVLQSYPEAPGAREFLVRQVQDILAILREMDEGPEGREDPSRAVHQAEELELSRRLTRRLNELDQHLEARATGPLPLSQADVESMRTTADELEAEAREEALHADRDLSHRSRNAVRVLVGSMCLAALGLGVMLWAVLRTVVRPLRALERRAEALGRGEPTSGPSFSSHDEIGALFKAFDEMSGRVTATRSALERSVEAKTRELVRAARYADLGVLAAGVAHEINNPLATIAACAEGMQRRLERGTLQRSEETEYFRTIASEAYRARDITQRLLTLARHEPGPATRIVLTTFLQELQRVTKHALERGNVRLEVQAPPGLSVRANSAELLQAFVNLVLNAGDASKAGMLVRVTAQRVGTSAVIDVDDEGAGVPPELCERVFEPFFTTKPPGQGTGLGLSLVAAILEGWHGSVVVLQSPQGGARFRVRLPLDQERPETHA